MEVKKQQLPRFTPAERQYDIIVDELDDELSDENYKKLKQEALDRHSWNLWLIFCGRKPKTEVVVK